jgi:hypothetical protein
MNILFETGYNLGKSGYPWQKVPPGFIPEKNQDDQDDDAALINSPVVVH